jgi:hypothetical protein
MSFEPTEDFLVLTNLQMIRQHRAWLDCEFTLYQKLCHNREVVLELQLKLIKASYKKEQRDAARRTNSKTI